MKLPNFVCGKLGAREASSFCDFWKITSCDITAFFSILIKSNLFVLEVLNKEYKNAYVSKCV